MLAPGTRLGPYEIEAPIGAGAMGEVYRARDARLERAVAIKVLPEALAADPDRLHRFTQEARAAGQLHHPNILAVFDVGTQDGIPYEVTELLEGETLRQRLHHGPMRTRRALEIAVQIAQGLAAAHEHGIVHRDLKPENLFLTHDGRLKILDFGLAKLNRQDTGRSGSDSLAGTITAAGVILGTAGYIAPEQVRGEAVDHRADLFALGAILYEMLSGKRAFLGESPVDTLHAILRTDPPEFAVLGVSVPPAVERIVRRCLEKQPEQRYQSARDLAFQLESARDPTTQTSFLQAVPRPRRLRWEWVAGAAAIVLAATGGALLAPRWLGGGSESRLVRLQMLPPAGTNLADNSAPAVSPDGHSIAFIAGDSTGVGAIWVRRLEDAAARRLPGTEDASLPFWSPDGKHLGFFSEAKLKKTSVDGGAVEVLCDSTHGRGGAWGSKGVIVFARGAQGPLYRIAESGGLPQPITVVDSSRGERAHRFPQFLPDGEHFVFMILGAASENGVGLGSLHRRETEQIATSSSGAVCAPSGELLYTRGGQFFAQPLDVRSGKLRGRAIAIGDAPDPSNTAALPVLSVSRAGDLVYFTPRPVQSRLYWISLDGRLNPISMPADRYLSMALSSDGERLAFVRRAKDLTDDIWVADLSTGVTSRLTREGNVGGSLLWSPDNRRIAYESLTASTADLVTRPAGGGEPVLLYRSPARFKHLESWSRDGRWVLINVVEQATNFDLWKIDLAQGGAASIFRRTTANENSAVISPDGKWVVYLSDESGITEAYVESFPEPGTRVQVSSRGAIVPYWSIDGRSVRFIGLENGVIQRVDLVTSPVLRASAPRTVFSPPKGIVTGSNTGPGDRFAIAIEVPQTEPVSLTVVLNWRQLLKSHRP